VDLHWRVVQKFKSRALDMAGIWRRTAKARLFDTHLTTFSPEDNLVALCLHAGHHGWMQISHFCDIAQLLLTYPKLDWGIVLSQLGDSNTRRIAHVCWFLLDRHWGAHIPHCMLANAKADPHVARLAQRVETEIWPSTDPVLTTASLRWLVDRTAGEEIEDRLRLFAGSVFWPAIEDFAAFRLPKMFSPLYFVLRPLRLVSSAMFAGRSWNVKLPQANLLELILAPKSPSLSE
jgi:hypothetical protein